MSKTKHVYATTVMFMATKKKPKNPLTARSLIKVTESLLMNTPCSVLPTALPDIPHSHIYLSVMKTSSLTMIAIFKACNEEGMIFC